MSFEEDIKSWAQKACTLKDSLQTEEAVKHSLLMPFIQLLGYDVFDPNEVVPEFISDHGVKKGEKVDYVIFKDQKPHILIEAKSINCNLDDHNSQLYRYFSVTPARFAILTNGICYRFFSDLDESNKMDNKPFLVFNLDYLVEQHIYELEKFHKKNYDVDNILSTANELKYNNNIKAYLHKQFKDPDEDFVKYIAKKVYDRKLFQSAIDWFRPIIKKSMNQFLRDLIDEKLKYVMNEQNDDEPTLDIDPLEKEENEQSNDRKIITTEEEIEAYVLIKRMLKESIGPNHKITYRDYMNHFSVLVDDNMRKRICRLHLSPSKKDVEFADGEKFVLEKVDDIENYKDKLIERCKKFI